MRPCMGSTDRERIDEMSKGKKRCYFCGINLTNQNGTQVRCGEYRSIWVDCCHRCKAKEDKK